MDLKEFMSEAIASSGASSRALLSQAAARVMRGDDHGAKLLLGLGGAAIALSAISMAHALATPVLPTTHGPRTLATAGYAPSSNFRFTDAADAAVLSLIKAYGVAPQATGNLLVLGQLAQSTPQIAPQAYRQLSPSQAQAINASIAFSSLPNPAARPFRIAASDVTNRTPALDCLTAAVYYEAASESDEGEAAVAQVVLNRLRHPIFPKTVCGVVFQGSELPTGCQFTFTCDGSLARRPSVDGWKRAEKVAARALDGYVVKSVGEATHYHTQWVVPYWQPTVTKLTQIGAHIFYRWAGGMGAPEAFHGQYAGFEARPDALSSLDPQIIATPAPAMLTVASATQAAQPVIVLARADLPGAPHVGGPATANAAQGAATEAVAETPKLAPEVKASLVAAAPRTSFFGGHGSNNGAPHW
jgi:spore germination cell wall hydrolase CwlJ-like protein